MQVILKVGSDPYQLIIYSGFCEDWYQTTIHVLIELIAKQKSVSFLLIQ